MINNDIPMSCFFFQRNQCDKNVFKLSNIDQFNKNFIEMNIKSFSYLFRHYFLFDING